MRAVLEAGSTKRVIYQNMASTGLGGVHQQASRHCGVQILNSQIGKLCNNHADVTFLFPTTADPLWLTSYLVSQDLHLDGDKSLFSHETAQVPFLGSGRCSSVLPEISFISGTVISSTSSWTMLIIGNV